MSIITSFRTIRIAEHPKLLWVEIGTSDGITGLGETFRGAATVEAAIHGEIAPMLLGKDSRQIGRWAYELQNPYVGYHSAGAETRAASAVDIALWDAAAKRQNVPVHEALGGAARDHIKVYNTCAGYSFNSQEGARREIGAGDTAIGPYDDQVTAERDPAALAESLVAEGYGAMKIWPFDRFATRSGSNRLNDDELAQGVAAFAVIRERVGNRIELMCELHSLWDAPTALRICKALEPYNICWVEDPITKMDDVATLADLRRRTSVPICASETLSGLVPYRDLLARDAVDYVMVDPGWCGGLTTGRKIAALAEAYARPLAPHDCTGPVALWAGLHLAFHAPTAVFQEVVRASLATWYGDIVDHLPLVEKGVIGLSQAPGLGASLLPKVFERKDVQVRESRLPG